MPARLPKASDIVVNSLRREILTKRMEAGARLPSEAELMAEYDMSRGTVREALRLLERDGLIQVRRGPGGGIRVRHPDITGVSEAITLLFGVNETPLRDFSEFRHLVEPAAAALAARNASDEDCAQLLVAAAEDTHEPSSSADFHGLLGRCSGNGVIQVVLAALHSPFRMHIRSERVSERSVDETLRAHTNIAERIAERDAEGASHAMTKHLLAYDDYLREMQLIDEPIVPRTATGL